LRNKRIRAAIWFLAVVLILAGLAALLFALPEPESSQRVATLAPTLFQPFQGMP
jgi:hypothetical protein